MDSQSPASGQCNDGAIVAISVGVSANHYTSVLNVTVQPDMINETVECVHHDISDGTTVINQTVLTEGNYIIPPPTTSNITCQDQPVIFR